MQIVTVTPNKLKSVLKTAYDLKRQVMMHGAPGIGKTYIVHELAAELGVKVIDIRLGQLEPGDLIGLPYVENDKAKYAAPELLPNIERDGAEGILFLDEVSTMPPMMQASAMQLINERRVGPHKVPDGWRIIAAGNRAQDKGTYFKLAPALANRMTHIEVQTSIESWTAWAGEHGLHTDVIAFLNFQPNHLSEFSTTEYVWPSPRTWEQTSEFLYNITEPTTRELFIAGTIGEALAVEFASFRRMINQLPNLEQVFIDPTNTPIPNDLGTKYAVTVALANKVDKTTVDNAMSYLLRDEWSPEFGLLFLQLVDAKWTETVKDTAAFSRYIVTHGDIVLID
jgi:hypothetical protein